MAKLVAVLHLMPGEPIFHDRFTGRKRTLDEDYLKPGPKFMCNTGGRNNML